MYDSIGPLFCLGFFCITKDIQFITMMLVILILFKLCEICEEIKGKNNKK
jgi:hypothetical protein